MRSLDSNTFDLKREDAVHDALDRLTGKFRKEDTDETVIATPIFPRQRQSDSPWQRQPELRGGDTLSPETSTHITKIENPRLESENEFRRSSVARNIETKGSPSPSDLNLPIDILLKSAEDRVAIVAAKKTTPRVPQNGTEDRPISMKQLPSSDHEPRKTAAPNFVRSHKSSPSMNSSGLPLKSKQNLFPTNSSMRFEPSSTNRDSLDDTSVRPLAMSPSQGRIDPDRKSTAANRGMGAYVQSAMLKREGSISKRWSTALPGGVSRSNTPASPGTRDAVIAIGRAPTPLSLSRDSSPTPEDPPSTQESVRRNVSRARAKSIVESLSKYSTSGIHPAVLEPPKPEATPPTTPSHLISKTFDQKRWSPTKSSWLESALKKGSDGGSPMLSKSTPALEPTVKQADNRTIVIPKPSSPPSRPVTESVSNLTSTSTALGQVTSSSKPLTDKSPTLESPKPLLPAKKRPPSVVEKPSPTGEKLVPGPKVELDFRGNLKRPQNLGNSIEKEDLPFLNVISRLRSTKTQNYKAQNVLKDNILAGKAALQALRPKPPDPMNGRHTSAQGAFKHSDNVSVNLSTLGPGTISESKPPLPIKHTISLSRRDSVTFPIHMESSSERVPTLASLLFRSPAPDDKSKDLPGMISSCGTSLDMGNECEKDKRCGNPPLVHVRFKSCFTGLPLIQHIR